MTRGCSMAAGRMNAVVGLSATAVLSFTRAVWAVNEQRKPPQLIVAVLGLSAVAFLPVTRVGRAVGDWRRPSLHEMRAAILIDEAR